MNALSKYMLTLAALISINNLLIASYEYDLVNLLADPIVVKINQKRVDNKDYYQIIQPGKTVKQVFNNAYCLERLSWAPWDKTAPFHGGLDFVDKTNGRIPEEKQREFGDKIAYNYAFIPMEIIMQPNELFQQTRKAAADLVKGADFFICQSLQTAKDVATGGFGDAFSGGGSSYSSFGSDTSNAPSAADKRAAIDANIKILTDIKEAINGGDSNLLKLICDENLAYLKQIFALKQIANIKGAINNSSIKATALADLDAAIKSLTDKRMRIVANTSSCCSPLKTMMDMDGTQRKCDFGLGKIANASGKLAGYTLCKSREFIIYYKVDADGIPMFDKYGRYALTATTVEGQ